MQVIRKVQVGMSLSPVCAACTLAYNLAAGSTSTSWLPS